MQIMTAHGVQEKDLSGIDFSKGIFSTKKKKITPNLESEIKKKGVGFAKPPNVTQEKWNSLSELEQMGWYLKNE